VSVYGDTTETFTAVGTVACSISHTRAKPESVIAEKVTGRGDWKALMPYGSTVNSQDRVASGGFTYEVNNTNRGEQDTIYTVAYMVKIV
jgi:hypothetical protein